MYDGWLWLSILKMQASPSPMSMTPAFSPGPWITQGAFVGRPRRWMREDLYEQCSFHMADTMPSSVMVGSRPISATKRSYSSGFSPCSLTSSGVMAASLRIIGVSRFEGLRRFGEGDEALEQAAPVGAADQVFDQVLRVGHHAE